jgi:hypothetical protein
VGDGGGSGGGGSYFREIGIWCCIHLNMLRGYGQFSQLLGVCSIF